MSVIAHWFEQQGISTVVIGLVREHLVKIRPPRALWVPFELGRPLGAPGNSEFQLQVLKAALSLVSRDSSEPVIADFSEDDPRATTDLNWHPPLDETCQSVSQEVQKLQHTYDQFVAANNRTTVGVSKLGIAECASIVDSLKSEEPHRTLRADLSPNLMARYAMDDLKAFYIETAVSHGNPSSRQILDWFWMQTYLGVELRRLREVWMKSDNEKLSVLGERFIVPHRWR